MEYNTLTGKLLMETLRNIGQGRGVEAQCGIEQSYLNAGMTCDCAIVFHLAHKLIAAYIEIITIG